jgi:hypothetical protein
MFAERLPAPPATLRVLERAAKSRRVPRPTRDKATGLLEFLRRVLVEPVLREKTAARALAVLEARLNFSQYFEEQFLSVLPQLLENDADGSLRRFLEGDATAAPDLAGSVSSRLTKRQVKALDDAWQMYLAGVHLVIGVAREAGDDAVENEAWITLHFATIHADTLLFPIMFLRDKALKPRPAVVSALIFQFDVWATARYDFAKEWAATVVSPRLDAEGQRLASLADGRGDGDLSTSPSDLFGKTDPSGG